MRKRTMILWITRNYNGFECARIPKRIHRPCPNQFKAWHDSPYGGRCHCKLVLGA